MEELQKSSKEILTELFDSFDAKPPSSLSDSEDSQNSSQGENDRKKNNKKKKSKKEKKSKCGDVSSKKKKKKKKKKKRKKKKKHRSRSADSRNDSDSQELKKSRSKKKRKRTHSESSDSSTQPTKVKRKEFSKQVTAAVLSNELNSDLKIALPPETRNSNDAEGPGVDSDSKSTIPASKKLNKVEISEADSTRDIKTFSEDTIETKSKTVLKVADVFVKDLIASGDKDTIVSLASHAEKPKMGIKITDLKKSSVFEAAEAQAKLKAERFEEGEISDSSRQSSSHSLSNIVDRNSVSVECKVETKHKIQEKKRHKHSKHHRSERRSHSSDKDSKRTSSCKSSSHSRSRDDSRSGRVRHRSREKKSKRSQSKDRDRHTGRSRSRSKDGRRRRSSDDKKGDERKRSKDRREVKSRSPYRHSRRRSRSTTRKQSRSRSHNRVELSIDKNKLLEIARKNALTMIKQGAVGTDANKMAAITAGGKTVDELTDFCKLLSQKDATGQESISSGSCHSSDSENGEKPFHHPFLLKDRPSGIVMNIRNCATIPVKTHQEKTAENAQQLRLQFPVSSGQLHRKTENEWVPVSPKQTEKQAVSSQPATVCEEIKDPEVANNLTNVQENCFYPPLPPESPSVFPNTAHGNIDIGEIVSQRLTAMRKLQDDPNDRSANEELQNVQNKMKLWAESKSQPGLFTGTTGARILSQAELASGQQAWVKKDQLISAQPVSGGMGMSLLQKMGWKPGEGLGKRNEGTLEPLKLAVKMDKRGLVCAEELPKRPIMPPKRVGPVLKPNTNKTFEGKHPVSLLVEFCTKRHYGPPVFTVCFEDGPSHKKSFIFKVTVNDIDYKGTTPSPNKKQAKSEAASVCLQSLGVLPP